MHPTDCESDINLIWGRSRPLASPPPRLSNRKPLGKPLYSSHRGRTAEKEGRLYGKRLPISEMHHKSGNEYSIVRRTCQQPVRLSRRGGWWRCMSEGVGPGSGGVRRRTERNRSQTSSISSCLASFTSSRTTGDPLPRPGQMRWPGQILLAFDESCATSSTSGSAWSRLASRPRR